MTDQAAALRRARAGVRPSLAAGDTPAVIIGSGKGGVGKSLLAVGMAATAAALGHRVLLVDGDQNLGNLHVLLGCRPAVTPEAMLDGLAADELPVEVAPRLWLVPADSGAESVQGLGATDRARLHGRVSALYADYDLVVVDAGAGLDSAVRCAAMRATRLVVLTLPEATALTDAYALIKIVHGELPGLPIDVVVNRVRDEHEGPAAWGRLHEAADRFLGRELGYIGAVPEDYDLRELVRQGQRLLDAAPTSPALRTWQALVRDTLLPALPIASAAS